MVAVDLDAARAAYAAEGQWTSPVLFTPAEITRFLDATERVVAGRHRGGVDVDAIDVSHPCRAQRRS